VKKGQKIHKKATLKGMSLVFCSIVDSMIVTQGKHHVLSCFILDLGGSRGISLCLHSPIYSIILCLIKDYILADNEFSIG
jgi:hypothetical protein